MYARVCTLAGANVSQSAHLTMTCMHMCLAYVCRCALKSLTSLLLYLPPYLCVSISLILLYQI
jgi:hypothetical protein